MPGNAPSRLATVTRVATASIAAGCLLAYLVIGAVRVAHPFEIEWLEGAMLDNVQRVRSGQPLYTVPSLDFVSFIYPPAFYYASAAVSTITGVGFVALRLVSFLSIVGVFALLYRLVVRESGDRFAALIATGLFAATFEIGGAWFDVGRVDSLFLLVLVGAMYVLRFYPSWRGHLIGGALVALAFFTKQSAVVMAAPLLLYACYRNWRHGLAGGLVALALIGGGTLLLDVAHGGWFVFYAFRLPQTYEILTSRLVAFWRVDVIPPLAVAWTIGLFYFAGSRADSPRLYYVALAAGVLTGAWISRGNPGGYDNVLIPVFLIASLLCGLGVAAGRKAFVALEPAPRRRAETWLAGACLLQFALLAYNPIGHLPRRGDPEEGRRFVQRLAAVEGDVWIPYHGHLATMAGKRQFAHWMPVSDILESGIDSLRIPLQAEVDSAIGASRFALVVVSNYPFRNSPDFAATYDVAGAAIDDPDALWPLTGSRRRAVTRYVPRLRRDSAPTRE